MIYRDRTHMSSFPLEHTLWWRIVSGLYSLNLQLWSLFDSLSTTLTCTYEVLATPWSQDFILVNGQLLRAWNQRLHLKSLCRALMWQSPSRHPAIDCGHANPAIRLINSGPGLLWGGRPDSRACTEHMHQSHPPAEPDLARRNYTGDQALGNDGRPEKHVPVHDGSGTTTLDTTVKRRRRRRRTQSWQGDMWLWFGSVRNAASCRPEGCRNIVSAKVCIDQFIV